MDTVQFTPASAPAMPDALRRPEAATAMTEVSGVMPRAGETPLPHGMGQTGEINKSRMADTVGTADGDIAPERVLKPWGLPMLPDLAKQEAAKEEDAEADQATVDSDDTATDALLMASPTSDTAGDPAPDVTLAADPAPTDPAQPARDPYESESETA